MKEAGETSEVHKIISFLLLVYSLCIDVTDHIPVVCSIYRSQKV